MSWSRVGKVGLPGLLLLAAGCGSGMGTIPCEGVVTLDGQPLADAAVSFVPAVEGGRPARAQTDAAGKFKLTTATPKDGALAGMYKVGVSKLEAAAAPPGNLPPTAPKGAPQLSGPPTGRGGPPPMPKSLVPGKYVNPDTSGIKVEVKAGMPPAKIELTSK